MSTMIDSEEDLFDLKYLEEISDLFGELKGMDNYYGLNLLKDNYSEYFEFIKNKVVICEFIDDELSDEDIGEKL